MIFAGKRDDVPNILSAADKFLFPSYYEGFPNALLEAEASGLLCVVSDKITKQAMINGLCYTVSLDASLNTWVEALERMVPNNRWNAEKRVIELGLDIHGEINRLCKLYDKCLLMD